MDAGEKKIIGKEVIKLKKQNGYLQDQIMSLTEKVAEANSRASARASKPEIEQSEDGEVMVEKKDEGEKAEDGNVTARHRRSRPSSARSTTSNRTYSSHPITGTFNFFYAILICELIQYIVDGSQSDRQDNQVQRLREVAQLQANNLKYARFNNISHLLLSSF